MFQTLLKHWEARDSEEEQHTLNTSQQCPTLFLQKFDTSPSILQITEMFYHFQMNLTRQCGINKIVWIFQKPMIIVRAPLGIVRLRLWRTFWLPFFQANEASESLRINFLLTKVSSSCGSSSSSATNLSSSADWETESRATDVPTASCFARNVKILKTIFCCFMFVNPLSPVSADKSLDEDGNSDWEDRQTHCKLIKQCQSSEEFSCREHLWLNSSVNTCQIELRECFKILWKKLRVGR